MKKSYIGLAEVANDEMFTFTEHFIIWMFSMMLSIGNFKVIKVKGYGVFVVDRSSHRMTITIPWILSIFL